MSSQLLSAPLDKVRSYFARPAPTVTNGPPPNTAHARSGSLRSARPFSTASSMTLGEPLPTPPPAAATHESELFALAHQSDLISNFWAGGRAQGMQVPVPPGTITKPRGRSMETLEMDEKRPREPKTLARRLFLVGFAFPLLWMAGLVLLFRPTKYAPDLERAPVGSAEEMRWHKAAYRAAEEKWARRCLWAFVTLLATVSVVVITVVLAQRGM
ncbi:hypothetical protein BV20DRAFT_1057619 [Pilatotrama ljubarskyi]|nr:hypothetical protein BV20DRAFT_1057619 [Pilatotrama ljubarskyi]